MLSGENSFGPLSNNIGISVNKIIMYNSSLTLLKNFSYVNYWSLWNKKLWLRHLGLFTCNCYKKKQILRPFLHRKFQVEVEAVSHCSNSHSTIISHFRVACYMCHLIYVVEPYKANATYLVSPDFAMTTTWKHRKFSFFNITFASLSPLII